MSMSSEYCILHFHVISSQLRRDILTLIYILINQELMTGGKAGESC